MAKAWEYLKAKKILDPKQVKIAIKAAKIYSTRPFKF